MNSHIKDKPKFFPKDHPPFLRDEIKIVKTIAANFHHKHDELLNRLANIDMYFCSHIGAIDRYLRFCELRMSKLYRAEKTNLDDIEEGMIAFLNVFEMLGALLKDSIYWEGKIGSGGITAGRISPASSRIITSYLQLRYMPFLKKLNFEPESVSFHLKSVLSRDKETSETKAFEHLQTLLSKRLNTSLFAIEVISGGGRKSIKQKA